MNDDVIHTTEYRGYKIEICPDEDAINPRGDWDDHATVMWCWHRRYELGDTKSNPWTFHQAQEEFDRDWEALHQAVIRRAKPILMAPLYLYDHSGLRIKIGSFTGLLPQGHAEFDTMPIGWVMVTKESYEKCCGSKVPKRKTKKFLAECQKFMEQDVRLYDDYLRGACYMWGVVDPSTGDILESCGGYYLCEHESYDDENSCLMQAARGAIDDLLTENQKQLELDLAAIP